LVSEKREKHKGCRKAQQSWEIFRADAETVGNSMFGNAIGVPDSIPVSAIDTLCAKRDNWVDHKRDYKDLAKVNNVASCATEQKAFENTMCTVLTAKASTCIAYDECIVAVNLQNEKTVTEAECDDRLAVEVVLAKTKCHLLHLSKVFNNEEDSTSDCDSVTVEDSSLVCTLQPVPAVSPCSSEADITSPTLPSPDGSDCSVWIAAEYSFDASYKPVTSCRIEEPCVLPTLIGTHDYSDGCTNSDSANICDFYDRHSDACSDYPGDDAVNKCCACGGGTPALEYVYGNRGTNAEDCPTGYVPIVDLATCVVAAASLGRSEPVSEDGEGQEVCMTGNGPEGSRFRVHRGWHAQNICKLPAGGPPPPATPCTWTKRDGASFIGYAQDDLNPGYNYDLEGAKALCLKLGYDKCQGLVCHANGCRTGAAPDLRLGAATSTYWSWLPSSTCEGLA